MAAPVMTCPNCKHELRESAQRLICAGCGAMLVPHAQLVDELDRSDVSITGDAPSALACPQCSEPMRACRIHVENVLVEHETLECTRDGVWLGGGMLADIVAKHARASGVTVTVPMPPVNAGASPRQRNPRQSFGLFWNVEGGGADPLSFRRRTPKPLVTTPFISAHAERLMMCPHCVEVRLEHHGDRFACRRCAGVFVETSALVQMMSALMRDPWEPAPPSGTPGSRPCPVCAQPLVVELLEDVTIDRCIAHGFWFDAEELGEAMAQTAEEPVGLVGKLHRMFYR